MNKSSTPTAATSSEIEFETINCPLCGCEKSQKDRSGGDPIYQCEGRFEIVKCDQCQHYFMNPRPKPEDIMKCYPEGYGPHGYNREDMTEESARENSADEATENTRSKPWYLSNTIRAIPGLKSLYYWLLTDDSSFLPTQPVKVLELGCGKGDFLQKLKQAKCEAQGVEPSEHACRVAESKGLNVTNAMFDEMQFEAEEFHVVYAHMVIEHLIDPKQAIENCFQMLKPGGLLIFTVPDYGSIMKHLLGEYWPGFQLPRHLQHFTKPQLRSLLAGMDFYEVQCFSQKTALDLVMGYGAYFRHRKPSGKLGQRMLNFADAPSLLGSLLLSPLAKILGWLGQSGRLTVIARKPGTHCVEVKAKY